MSSRLELIRERIARFPRFARFAAVAAILAIVAVPLANVLPRSLVVHYDLGASHQDIRVLQVAYVPVGQAEARVITLRFPGGAPREYDHPVDLPPGRYELHVRVETVVNRREYERYIVVGRGASLEVSLDPASGH